MENIRILLDLSELKDRVHKYVWILVSTIDLKYIADFKNAVIKKLALDRNDIKMFINGGLLLEEEKIMILRENDTVQIHYENLPNSACHSSSYLEIYENRSPHMEANVEEYQESSNKVGKRSKKQKRISEVGYISKENNDQNLSKDKRKRDMSADFKSEKLENVNLIQVETPIANCGINKDISEEKKKKHKKSSSFPALKEVITINESNGPGESSTKPVDVDAEIILDDSSQEGNKIEENAMFEEKKKKRKISSNTSTLAEVITVNGNEDSSTKFVAVDADITLNDSPQESRKIEERSINTPSEIVIESFVQGNNCKKKKRKRSRKRKIEHNLVSPFISENIEKIKENSPNFTPSDNFASLRKHIIFSSSTLDINSEKVETVNSDSESEISINRSCVSPNAKPTSFPARYQTNSIAKQASPKFLTSPNAKGLSVTTCKTYADDAHKTTPNLSALPSIACTIPILKTPLFPTFGNSANSIASRTSLKNSMPAPQNFPINNPWTVSPVQKKKGVESSQISVLTNKECETTKHHILSYSDYPPLNALPPIGTHLAFKLLELDENYSPEVSNYKEGVIKGINPKTEELEIELSNVEVKPGRNGKFENLKEDEAPLDEVIKTVATPWSSLIEPRLLSHI